MRLEEVNWSHRFIAFMVGAHLLLMGCGDNIYKGASNQSSDAAYLEQAKTLLDASDYTGALAAISSMSVSKQAEREVLKLKASAYAGRCGMTFFSLYDILSNMTGNLFLELMAGFPGATAAQVADCVAAESTLTTIGAVGERTASENLLMALIAFAKIGTILSKEADTDADGAADGGFDYCATIVDDDMKHLVTGMGNLLLSLPAAGSNLGGASTGAISAMCASLPAGQNFCEVGDVASVTADHILGMRGLVGTQDDPGLGTCANDIANCIAACP